MVTKSWARGWALIAAAVLIGGGLFAMTPASAELRSAAASVWQQVKPKADQRYVKKTDRSKIVRTAAAATGTSQPVTGDITPMSTTIKAPSKGFLVVEGHGTYNIPAPTPLLHCGISIDGDTTWPSQDSISASVIAPAGPISCDHSARITVAKGSHSVAYQVHNDGSGTANFRGGSIAVTFVAFGAKGKPPVLPKQAEKRVGDLNR